MQSLNSSRRGRLEVYESLSRNREAILAQADKLASDIGIPAELAGRIGPTGASSALPGTMRKSILRQIEEGMLDLRSPRAIGDEIRGLVKSVYGDEYDAALANSCEAALGVAFDTLLTPPAVGIGEPYRARVIGVLERHSEHQLSYGRPFPPIYKDIFADRGSTAGELGLLGRRRDHTDCVFVPMAGGRHELHGMKMHPAPLLAEARAGETAAAMARAASIHAANLTGFVSLGYDTPGYGYGERTADGAPLLQWEIGELAREYGVPYLCDNAWGTPIIGTNLRATGADVMLFSMDKVAGAPTSGLIIGREWPMVNVRRALGVHSDRFGTTSAHGKGSHVSADPGKMTMLGALAALRLLRDRPDQFRRPIDQIFAIVEDEYAQLRGTLPEGITITKSYNLGGVELNYERSWTSAEVGIPIFTNEDRISGNHLLNQVAARMGVLPGQSEDANVLFTAGLGTVDDEGELVEETMRLVVRSMLRALGLLHRWAAEER